MNFDPPIPIPFGYKRVYGTAIRGDGIWNGTKFVPVKKAYPSTEPKQVILVRKCVVEQLEIQETDL